jgi:hypothetical protein
VALVELLHIYRRILLRALSYVGEKASFGYFSVPPRRLRRSGLFDPPLKFRFAGIKSSQSRNCGVRPKGRDGYSIAIAPFFVPGARYEGRKKRMPDEIKGRSSAIEGGR